MHVLILHFKIYCGNVNAVLKYTIGAIGSIFSTNGEAQKSKSRNVRTKRIECEQGKI